MKEHKIENAKDGNLNNNFTHVSQTYQSVTISNLDLELDQLEFVKNSLTNHFIFRDLSEDIMLNLF